MNHYNCSLLTIVNLDGLARISDRLVRSNPLWPAGSCELAGSKWRFVNPNYKESTSSLVKFIQIYYKLQFELFAKKFKNRSSSLVKSTNQISLVVFVVIGCGTAGWWFPATAPLRIRRPVLPLQVGPSWNSMVCSFSVAPKSHQTDSGHHCDQTYLVINW